MPGAPLLSIVVPVGPGDLAWTALQAQLAALPAGCELLWSASAEPGATVAAGRWLVGAAGRARQLNAGAAAARGQWLWLLHADSRLYPETLAAALGVASSSHQAAALHYFRLRFDKPRPWPMWLTEFGIALRCRLFGLPFGDQGFLLPRALYQRLGPFDEAAAYGEDHLYVWRCHRAGIPVRALPACLGTSARKYAERGWWRTTLTHLRLTWTQASAARSGPRS